jgi:hypothetical protein
MPDSFELRLRKSLKNTGAMKTPSCLETETIGLYIEDKLPEGEKMRVEKHVASCLYCLDQLVELRELVYLQKHTTPLPSHLLQKIVDIYPKEERPIKQCLRDILVSSVQKASDLFAFPLRQWRYATVSIATALVVILALVVYRGFTPEKPFEMTKIPKPGALTMLRLTEVKNPIIIKTKDVDETFERVRVLIQAHNGKMLEALWIEKGIKLTFTLKKEEETSLFDDFSKLGEVIAKEEGYRDKKGNIVVLLKER